MADLETNVATGPGVAFVPPPPPTPGNSVYLPTPPTPGARARRRRPSKWDPPGPPKDWRWWIGGIGKVLIAVGLLLFGFVAYQLWGTGIETARAQNQLENEFEQLLSAEGIDTLDTPVTGAPGSDTDPAVDPGTGVPGSGEPDPNAPTGSLTEPEDSPGGTGQADAAAAAEPVPVEQQVLPALDDGDALARIEIPRIGITEIVVAGVKPSDLKRGPGHYPDTPMPGQLGNSAIAGHRTTYGQPFHDVDKLQVGDEIVVTTLNGRFVYQVTGQQIVSPSDYHVVATVDPTVASLTLTSCHPKWTARQRIVITSVLVPEASAQVGEPVLNYGRPDDASAGDAADGDPSADGGDTIGGDNADALPGTDTTSGDDVTVDDVTGDGSGNVSDDGATGSLSEGDDDGDGAVDADVPLGVGSPQIADAFSNGWFSDPGANLQVGLWGSLLAAIGIGAFLLSRQLRRDWAGALVGIIPFLVTLYFFFQNVNRLLPPNL